MLDTLQHLETDGFIYTTDANAARQAERTGIDDHTIGYELELLPSAAPETRRVVECELEEEDPALEVYSELSRYGYETGAAGVFELRSPPAKHPLPLAVATRGIVRTGWLPKTPQGVVTSHVNIGFSGTSVPETVKTDHRLVNLLRAVDLTGGTTPGRLLAPVRLAQEGGNYTSEHSWNRRGFAGVSTLDIGTPRISGGKDSDFWKGENSRIEFRTVRYQSPEQFGQTLERLYFLTRGLLAGDEEPAGTVYGEFEEWFGGYRQAQGLPGIEGFDAMSAGKTGTVLGRPRSMDKYIRPYADHLGTGDTSELTPRVSQTVAELAKEFGMSNTLQPA